VPAGNINLGVTTFNAQVPAEGPKVSNPVVCDFSAASSYEYNTYLTQASAEQRSIAGCFIDNSSNGQEVEILISVSNQLVKCPAHSQGFFTLFVPKNAVLTMTDPSGESTAVVNFIFTNFPVANAVWGVSGDLT
jgi:hypothetical protein